MNTDYIARVKNKGCFAEEIVEAPKPEPKSEFPGIEHTVLRDLYGKRP